MKRLWAHPWRISLVWAALVICLTGLDYLCGRVSLPVQIEVWNGEGRVSVGSQQIALGKMQSLIGVKLDIRNPVRHEYQLDGSDSTNNFTEDVRYLQDISSSSYYRLQSWLRGLDSLSRWQIEQVKVQGVVSGQVERGPKVTYTSEESNGATIRLPEADQQTIDLALERPETPRQIILQANNAVLTQITINRNDRYVLVTRAIAGGVEQKQVAKVFFPEDSGPFAAMVLDLIIRVVLLGLCTCLVVVLGEAGLATISHGKWLDRVNQQWGKIRELGRLGKESSVGDFENQSLIQAQKRLLEGWKKTLFVLHPLALVSLLLSFGYVIWIALVQYHGEPHIYDASAYLFAAKIYAQGHFSVPIPVAADRFPGPFMVQVGGRWFPQYAPGTGLTLVPGIWSGMPWLVEPVLGTLALLGIGLIGKRLYNRRVGSLAVILGACSPFYSYLAASYLSHAIALFYIVWGLYLLLRFCEKRQIWELPLATICFGMAALTRDLVTLLFVVILVPGVFYIEWARVKHWKDWLIPGLLSLVLVTGFILGTALFNLVLTGSTGVTPRELFFSGDHWGFGDSVGFYGRHTIAAGLVNLDEQLTLLSIDLFGWPAYCSLLFIGIPFFAWRARRADHVLLACLVIVAGSFIGYFYHGIYLGPRYLYETLPMLCILTARGIVVLGELGWEATQKAWTVLYKDTFYFHSLLTGVIVVLLLGSTIGYYLPRQKDIYQNYTGMSGNSRVDLTALYKPDLTDALVVTSDYSLYQLNLFALNDPYLQGKVIYAYVGTDADITELKQAYPKRKMYKLIIGESGSIFYQSL